jgi:cytochrome bd-type quinol oxidase subunit 2
LLFFGGSHIFDNPQFITGIALAIAVFLFLELFIILYTDRKNKTISSRKSVNLFLGYKIGRIFISLLFIAIYAAVIKVELKRFIGVFLLLYFIFLLFDTVYLVKREKILKNSEMQSKEIVN